jgi:mannosyl-3-phosphoglycerate phosphatase
MDKSVTSGTSDASYLLIFTDLDGTLLDADTYGWKEALPALDQCRRRGIPVVLVSSKTRAEMESLHRKLRLSAPFISENGGGIFFSSGSIMEPPAKAVFDNGLWKWSLGVPYAHLIKGLREIRNELGWNLKGFSDMSIEEISCLTGLDEDTSRLAVMREFDEPFVASVGQAVDWKVLSGAAAKRGLTVTMGGRFYHLQGKNDKGQAMGSVIAWYKQGHRGVITVALGDSPNDFSMLECADFPVLIRSQKPFPEIKQRITRLRVSREMGPKGWNTAVLDFLQHKEEQRNAWQASQRD